MRIKVIKIGNSRGIRIPKSVIEQTGLKNEVELELRESSIIIKPSKKRRDNWKSAFAKMAKQKDDVLLDKEVFQSSTYFDEEEWE